MPRINPIFNSFSSGELSPRLYARTDVDRYKSGVKSMVNFLPLPHGPAMKRPGFRFVATAQVASRLIPFEVNGQGFVLEVGDYKMWFYTQGAQLPVELVTPWAAADLAALQYAQNENTLWLAHGNHAPRKLTRVNDTSWTLDTPAFTAAPWGANYPRTLTFHQQRLYFGGNAANPQSFWASKTGDFLDFTSGANDADALAFTIASDVGEAIVWMVSGKALVIGCANSEYAVSGKPITPTNFDIARQSGHGSSGTVQPDMAGNDLLYIQRGGTKLRGMAWQLDRDAFVSAESSLIAEHLFTQGVVDQAYTRLPDAFVWEVMTDGSMVAVAWMGSNDATGFARITTAGEVKSVCPTMHGVRSELWAIIERDGVRRVEVLDLLDDAYADSYIRTSAPAGTVSGLSHLNGKTVKIVADGALHPDRVVTGGGITLEGAAQSVVVGLPYTASLTTLPLEGANPAGTSLTQIKRWNEIVVHLWQSILPLIDGDRPPVTTAATLGKVKPLVSDIVRASNLGYNRHGSITIEQDLPYACTVLGIFGTVAVND